MKKAKWFLVLFLVSLNAYSEGFPFAAPMPAPMPMPIYHATQVNILVRPVMAPNQFGAYGGYQQGYGMYPGYGGGYGRPFCGWRCRRKYHRRGFFLSFSSFGRRGGFSFGLGIF